MSELYSTNAPDRTADTAEAAQHETVPEQRTADDTDLQALHAQEENLSEPRTRQEAAVGTWDRPLDADDDGQAQEYDADLDALQAKEADLAEPRTREEAAADSWDRPPGDPDDEGLAREYDGDFEALQAQEESLPEPGTRQEAAAETWDQPLEEARRGPDPLAAESVRADDNAPADIASSAVGESAEIDRSDPGVTQLLVHTEQGTAAPLTVVELPPEGRTLGDDSPTGIGLKPTGEQIENIEPKDAPDRFGRMLRKATEDADNLEDATHNLTEAVHNFNLPNPGSGHAYEGYAAHEQHVPDAPAASDLVGAAVLTGVALIAGGHHWLKARRERNP